MIKLNSTVNLFNLQPSTVLAIFICEDIMSSFTPDHFVLTSVNDSVHMPKSKHYEGNAFDLRRPVHFFNYEGSIENMVGRFKLALGAHYDVVLEDDHIHVEYDPKATQSPT